MKVLLVCLCLIGSCASVNYAYKSENANINHLLVLADGIYTGAAPEGAASFAALAELGVTTVVCVDSAQPNVELAAAYGMKYIHIPIEYSEVSEHAQLSVKRMIEDGRDDVFYIHCHHGKHRGPAVAAIAWRQRSGVNAASALKVLKVAGTSADYPGLWRDVREWKNPATAELPELHAIAPIGSFASGMAMLDRNWDRIKLLRKNKWQVPETHPDLVVLSEAQQTRDLLRDCSKELPAELADNQDLINRMKKAVGRADDLFSALQNKKSEAVELSYKELKSSCVNCHRKYRND
ncbi:MAG: cytochrome c [Planctomycetes bacterium]|nr:cytochrome c [Planctomycetota bacterium]